jgi:hypothetical protein
MNNRKIALVAVLAIAAVMIAAATVLPTHNALASKCKQKANNSQHAAFGAGSSGNTATSTPTNTQTQTCNIGSTTAH